MDPGEYVEVWLQRFDPETNNVAITFSHVQNNGLFLGWYKWATGGVPVKFMDERTIADWPAGRHYGLEFDNLILVSSSTNYGAPLLFPDAEPVTVRLWTGDIHFTRAGRIWIADSYEHDGLAHLAVLDYNGRVTLTGTTAVYDEDLQALLFKLPGPDGAAYHSLGVVSLYQLS